MGVEDSFEEIVIPNDIRMYIRNEAHRLNSNRRLRRTISCRTDYLDLAFRNYPEILPFLQQVYEYNEIQHLLTYFQMYPQYIQDMIFYR